MNNEGLPSEGMARDVGGDDHIEGANPRIAVLGETLRGNLDPVTQRTVMYFDSTKKMVERRNERLIDRPNPGVRIDDAEML